MIGMALFLLLSFQGMTASDMTSQPPPSPRPLDYSEIRQAMGEAVPSRIGLEESFIDGKFDVRNCEIASRLDEGQLEARPEVESAVEQVAFEAVILERAMREAGYSEAVFRQPLNWYELDRLTAIRTGSPPDGAELNEAIERAQRNLVTQLNAARVRQQRSAPEFISWGECDYHGDPITVTTAPGEGRVWMNLRRDFEICEAHGADPWNRDRCAGWSEIQVGQPHPGLRGRYVYDAVWPNGRRGRSMSLIIAYQDVTIRPD